MIKLVKEQYFEHFIILRFECDVKYQHCDVQLDEGVLSVEASDSLGYYANYEYILKGQFEDKQMYLTTATDKYSIVIILTEIGLVW